MKGQKTLIAILAVLLLAGAAAADNAYVYGKIYVAGTDTPIAGADVTVKCEETGLEVSSLSDAYGTYDSYGTGFDCPQNTLVTVTASKDGRTGSAQGILTDDYFLEMAVALVDVPLAAPEIIALLAAAIVLAPGMAYTLNRKR